MFTLKKFRFNSSENANTCRLSILLGVQSKWMNRTCGKSSFLSYQQQDEQKIKSLYKKYKRYYSSSWNIIVPNQLKEMFTFAEYSPDRIRDSMNFYYQFIKPYLGPEPSSPRAEWKSYINDDYSPIETTYSFKINDKHPVVKCIFEPIERNEYNGEISNISAALKFIEAIKFAHLSKYNFDILSMLIKSTFIQDYCQQKYHLCFGFDFGDSENTFPLIKAYIGSSSDRSPGALPMCHHVSNMMKLLKLNKAWQSVLDYHKTLPHPHIHSDIDCFSVDCADNTCDKMRVKVYIRYFHCKIDNLIQHLTLNGCLSDTNINFHHVLKQWDYFLSPTKVLCSPDNNVTKSFLLYYEFDQSKSDYPISTKFYFPIRHYVENDQILTYKIAKYLNDIGYEKYGGIHYITHINNLCKHRSLDKRSGYHRLIAGSLSKDNPEFKLYYSPELYAPERFSNHLTS